MPARRIFPRGIADGRWTGRAGGGAGLVVVDVDVDDGLGPERVSGPGRRRLPVVDAVFVADAVDAGFVADAVAAASAVVVDPFASSVAHAPWPGHARTRRKPDADTRLVLPPVSRPPDWEAESGRHDPVRRTPHSSCPCE